jgi:hypothetical protein
MARAYTVGTVALALAIPIKWIDNVLSHHALPGVFQQRQGVSRKVSLEGVLQLALAIDLIQDLQVPTPDSLHLAALLTEAGGNYRTKAGISIEVDLPRIRVHLETRLAEAVEVAPIPRRGRPPRMASSKTGRLD